jgi:hypothetical protein
VEVQKIFNKEVKLWGQLLASKYMINVKAIQSVLIQFHSEMNGHLHRLAFASPLVGKERLFLSLRHP